MRKRVFTFLLFLLAAPQARAAAPVPPFDCPALLKPETYAGMKPLRYIVEGKDGWIFATRDFKSDYAMEKETAALFGRLAAALERKGQALVVALQPSRAAMAEGQVDPKFAPEGYDAGRALASYRGFLKALEEAGIAAPDLSEAKGAFFMARDTHWSQQGADEAARIVALALSKLPQMRDVPRLDFETSPTGRVYASRGYLGEFVAKACGLEIAEEKLPLIATAKVTAGDADALLGEEESPLIAIAGTSNTATEARYGFAGALSRHARADVYNAAVSGGGFGTSAMTYFASNGYHQSPPKIIVWEFLSHHDVNINEARLALRQMIPAVHGACDGPSALSRFSGHSGDMFGEIAGKALPPSYIYVEAGKEPALDILYADGSADRVDFTRDDRAKDEGRYFFELMPGAVPLFFRVKPRDGAEIRALLCAYEGGK